MIALAGHQGGEVGGGGIAPFTLALRVLLLERVVFTRFLGGWLSLNAFLVCVVLPQCTLQEAWGRAGSTPLVLLFLRHNTS